MNYQQLQAPILIIIKENVKILNTNNNKKKKIYVTWVALCLEKKFFLKFRRYNTNSKFLQ